jgi:hypothetical protein
MLHSILYRVPKQFAPKLLKAIYGKSLIPTKAHIETLRLNVRYQDDKINAKQLLCIIAIQEVLEARIKAQDLYWKILYRQLGSVDLVAIVLKKIVVKRDLPTYEVAQRDKIRFM